MGQVLVSAATEEFFVSREPNKGSPHTTSAYKSDLGAITVLAAGQLGAAPGELSLGALAEPAVLRRAFAAHAAGRSPATVRRCWSVWNQFFGFAVAEGWLAGNPMAGVGRPKAAKGDPKPIEGADSPERLLEAIAAGVRPGGRDPWPERDLAFVATALCTGLRLSELLSLRVSSLDGRQGERRIKVTGKGRKRRSVPVEAPLEVVIDAYLATRRSRFGAKGATARAPLFVDRSGEELRRGGAQYLVKAWAGAAGIANRLPQGALVHALRHTYANRLAEDGASATEIQRLLGHESLTTSQGYIDATANAQRDAAKANRTYQSLRRLAPTPAPPLEHP